MFSFPICALSSAILFLMMLRSMSLVAGTGRWAGEEGEGERGRRGRKGRGEEERHGGGERGG